MAYLLGECSAAALLLASIAAAVEGARRRLLLLVLIVAELARQRLSLCVQPPHCRVEYLPAQHRAPAGNHPFIASLQSVW